MKKIYHLIIFLLTVHTISAQTILSEDFETQALPTGWTQQTSATDGGWKFGSVSSQSSTYWPVVDTGSNVAATNDDACNCDKSNDRFITPSMDLSAYATILLEFDAVFSGGTEGGITETAFIDVSTDGGNTWVENTQLTGTLSLEWGSYQFDLSSLAGYSDVKIAFRFNDGGGWLFGFMIDNVFVFAPSPNNAKLSEITTSINQSINDDIFIEGNIRNVGSNSINSMDVTWSDGTNSYTDNLSGLNIASFGNYSFSHAIPYSAPIGISPISVTISNINSNVDSDPSDNTLIININGVSFVPQRNIICEMTSATWVGFSPRAYVMMESMQNDYPETFLGILIHGEGDDPMEVTDYMDSYANNIITGYPSGSADRSDGWLDISPEQIEEAHNALLNEMAPAELSFTNITYNSSTRALSAELSARFALALTGDYRLNLILVEDGVTGSTTSWNQENAYSGDNSNNPVVGAGHDWESEPDPVLAANMVYDDVARAIVGGFTGEANSLPTSMAVDDVHNHTFSITLPADWDHENIRLIGALQDNENSTVGRFLNGVGGVITCNIDGIQNGGETGIDCGGPSCVPCAVAPSITSHPTDVTTYEGTAVTFSITADNATSYQWYVSTNGGTSYNPINNNGVYAGSTTTILTVTPTLAMDSNLYQCLVLGNTNPPAISSSAALYVNPLVPPSITSQPVDITTTEGVNATFSISAENTTNYQWYESTNGGSSYNPISDNGVYSGSTTSSLTVTPTLLMDNNRYQCLVSGQVNPPAISNAATLTVIESSCPAPTNTNVEMTTITNAVFSWDNMPNATFYQVKYRLKGTAAWSTSGTASTQRSVSLTAKKYYQFKVRAQCGAEWSDFSDIQLFYTSTCDVPTGVASIYLDNTRMRVRWDNNPDEIKGKIRWRAVGITNWVTQNSQDGNNFLYVNDLPANALIQYKVRSNCDGNDWSAYSPLYTHDLAVSTRLVQEENVFASTKIYPNPTRDILNMEFETKDAEEVNIIISNNLGRTIHTIKGTYNQGIQTETIDMSRFATGYYFITIRSGERMETQKFMKMD